MIICGIKITHDGGVAVVDDGQLIFSIESEKMDNAGRHSAPKNLEQITEILDSMGLSPRDVHTFAIDGWGAAPGADRAELAITSRGITSTIKVAPYQELNGSSVTRRYEPGVLPRGIPYVSYHHATSHIFSAYCTSPFSREREDALVLVWDGGMLPNLYSLSGADMRVARLGAPLFPLMGNAFGDFSAQLEPYFVPPGELSPEERFRRRLSTAGKAMAFAGLGSVREDSFPVFQRYIDEFRTVSVDMAEELGRRIRESRDEPFSNMSHADLIASFQDYLGELLVRSLERRVKERGFDTPNLCLVGGCALNIKWNSAIRRSGLFRQVWVPPFPNDSGAAIGAACSEMVHQGSNVDLAWGVYQGPSLHPGRIDLKWHQQRCTTAQLARLLHDSGDPVVVVNGRAELGPRALGNRSILAPPTDANVKKLLNHIKQREDYRPVAPICLEDRAPQIFSPGTPDPYMLFDHRVRQHWLDRIPAVVHLDGTARLQTVTSAQNHDIADVLHHYEKLSGIPVLCNTSANLRGRGFFPDIASALAWGQTPHVWSAGILYTRPDIGQPEIGH